MKTAVTSAKQINRTWHLIDAKGQTLGRLSTKIATLLMGKNKTYFTPNLDCGDYVVVINATDIKVTGQKTTGKIYRHHTGYPGGFREYPLAKIASEHPERVIEHSVKGMLPKNKLRAPRLKRLKIFVTDNHPYQRELTKES